ncbi:hypothetical protein RFI_21859, partial [Reticulomyxa filosa]
FGRILGAGHEIRDRITEVNKDPNKFYNEQEKIKKNAKGVVNQMLSTKTNNLNKSSMMYDINPDCLDDEQFFPGEEEEGEEGEEREGEEEEENYKPDMNSCTDSKNCSTKCSKMDTEDNNTTPNKYNNDSENNNERPQIGWEEKMSVDDNDDNYDDCCGNGNVNMCENDTSQRIGNHDKKDMRQNKNYESSCGMKSNNNSDSRNTNKRTIKKGKE